jgi:hypothetical protein
MVMGVAVCLLVAGCGSSGSPIAASRTTASTSSSSTTTIPPVSTTTSTSSTSSGTSPSSKPTAKDKAFCALLVKYSEAANSVGNPKTLGEARKDFAAVVGGVDNLVPATPASLRSSVQALDKDVRAIQHWIDTKATLKELVGNKTPAAVAKPLADFDKQSEALHTWAASHCA